MTEGRPRLPRHKAGNRRSSVQFLQNADPVRDILLREDTEKALKLLESYGSSADNSVGDTPSGGNGSGGTAEPLVANQVVLGYVKPLTKDQEKRTLTGRCLRQAQIEKDDTVVMRDLYFEVLDGPLSGSKFKVESCGIFPGTSPFFTYKIVYKDCGRVLKASDKALEVELIYSWIREEVTVKDVRDFLMACGGRRFSVWFAKEGKLRSSESDDHEREAHVLTHDSYLRMQAHKKELLNFIRYCVLDGFFFSDRGMLLRAMLRILTNCGRRDTFMISNPKEFEWAATVITELPFMLSSIHAMEQCGIIVAALEIRPTDTSSKEYQDRLWNAFQALKKFVLFNELDEMVLLEACGIIAQLDHQCETNPRKPFLLSNSFIRPLQKSALEIILHGGKLLSSFGPPERKLITYYSEARPYLNLAKLLLSDNHIEWHIVSKLPWESVSAIVKSVISEYRAHAKVIVPDVMKSKLEMVKKSFPIAVELMSEVARNYHQMKSSVILIMFAEELDPASLLDLLSGCAETLRRVYAIVDISQANMASLDADYSKIAVDFLLMRDVKSGMNIVRHSNLPLMKNKPEPQLAFGRERVFDLMTTNESLTQFFNHQVRTWDGTTAGGKPVQFSSSLKEVMNAYLSSSVPQDSYCIVSPNKDPDTIGLQIREGKKLVSGCLAISKELNTMVSVVSFVHTDPNISKYIWNERCYVYCFVRTSGGDDIHHTLPQGDLTPHFAYDVQKLPLPSPCNTVILDISHEIPKVALLRWILIAKHRVLLVGPRSAILKSLMWKRGPRPLSTLLNDPNATQELEQPKYAKDTRISSRWVQVKEELYFRDQETISGDNLDRAREALYTIEKDKADREVKDINLTRRRRKSSILPSALIANKKQSSVLSDLSEERSLGSSQDFISSFKDRKTGAVSQASILKANALQRKYSKSVELDPIPRSSSLALGIDVTNVVMSSIEMTEQGARDRARKIKKRGSIATAIQTGSIEDYLDSRAQDLYKPLSVLELKAKHGSSLPNKGMVTAGSPLNKAPSKRLLVSSSI